MLLPLYAFGNDCSQTILYLPLDERFATRDTFLNLAEITPYCILSPSVDILPLLKVSGNIEEIHKWVDDNAPRADAMIISAEMFLYGGLIASRISNDTIDTIQSRVNKLANYVVQYPHLNIFVSNVVMRIPSYDGDFEEPWFWADYGNELFTYSFYTDKYNQLQNPEDLLLAKEAVSIVPESAVTEFLWRRDRNHNITLSILNLMETSTAFHYFYTTLDDNAEYGFNIREAADIKDIIAKSSNLSDEVCPVYPGADEVHLTMLAKFCVSSTQSLPPALGAIYRDPASVNSIPSYEGQPMIDTLSQQVKAAGGILYSLNTPTPSTTNTYDGYLFVNNFSGESQEESSQQPDTGSIDNYSLFDPYISLAYDSSSPGPIPIGFCDNRYANGADKFFVEYMGDRVGELSKLRWNAYAGWNTNGNTIGTVVANTILLSLFKEAAGDANAAFNSLRVLEDMHYQSETRSTLMSYVDSITNTDENTSNLEPDLSFYQRFVFKPLSARYDELALTYSLETRLDSTYFPWNRTFEIGLRLTTVA